MRIAVVGCGALGSFYGAKLCHAGHEVHFLLRSDYETVRREGVWIRSREGNLNVRPRCAQRPEEIGQADLVLIGLKTTANEQFSQLLPPLVSPSTIVLTLQNGLGNEESLAELFPVEQIMGGLCFVCLNRVAPGTIHHLDHGRIVLGEFRRWPETRTHATASLFRQAGVPCRVTDNLARAHWEKLVWNIPFNGLGVAACAGLEAVLAGQVNPQTPRGSCFPTDQLLGAPAWERLVQELMEEVISVANARELQVDRGLAEKLMAQTRSMGTYKASTLIDFERGLSLELESLFLHPLRLAREAGVPVPRLAALCSVLAELNPNLSS